MPNLATIDHCLDIQQATCRAIIETPKASRTKYAYDGDLGVFAITGMLPAGMNFPLDFGFIPGTLAQDGDPLDVLVIGDEPSVVGCLANIQILGVIEAEQTERDGQVVRNDRIVARIDASITYRHAAHIDDLGQQFVDHLGQFFVNYNELKHKTFRVLRTAGPERAAVLIRDAASHLAAK